MRETLKKKIKSRAGFTLAEVLMAVLILLMVSAVVAAGIPSAISAYRKVTDAANAELLLSTTMTCLRDELGTASDIDVSGTTITYTNSAGERTVLSLDTASEKPGIYIQEYAELLKNDSRLSDFYHLLVSHEAANRSFFVTYTVDYDDVNGILTFHDLAVKRGTETFNTIPTLKIRVLTE